MVVVLSSIILRYMLGASSRAAIAVDLLADAKSPEPRLELALPVSR